MGTGKLVRWPLVAAGLACMALVAQGCDKSEKPQDKPTAEGKTGADKPAGDKPAGDKPAGDKPAGDKTGPAAKEATRGAAKAAPPVKQGKDSALGYLPKDTLAVFSVSNPAELLDKLGRQELMKSFSKEYEQAVAAVTQMAGQNLLDPANLSKIGIAHDKPAGIAWLSMEKETGAFFFSLTNKDTFKENLYALAGKVRAELKATTEGDAILIAPERDTEVVVVLRGSHGYVAFADRDEAGMEAAKAIATTKPEESLATSAGFTGAMGHVKRGGDASGWFHAAPVIKALMAREEKRSHSRKEDKPYGVEQLEAAKKEGNQEEIDRWQKVVDEEKKWQERWAKRREAERKLIEWVYGGVEALAMGTDLGKTAAVSSVPVLLEKGSMLTKLFKNSETLPPVIRAWTEKPAMLFAGSADPAEGLRFFEMVVATEGGGDFKDELKKAVGIDWDAEVAPLISGEAGFVMSVDYAAIDYEARGPGEAMSGALTFRVTDAAKATALVDKIAGLPMVSKLVSKEGPGAFSIDVPDFRKVYVRVVGQYLTASSDADFSKRVVNRGGVGPGFADKLSNAESKQLLAQTGKAFTWVYSADFMGFFLLARGSYAMSGSETHMANPTPEFEAKQKELEAVRKEIRRIHEEEEKKQNEAMVKLFDSMGLAVMQVEMTDYGMLLSGGQYIHAESFAKLIESSVKGFMMMEGEGKKTRNKVWELQEKQWKLEEELRKMGANVAPGPGEKAVAAPVGETKATVEEAPSAPVKSDAPAKPEAPK